LAVSLQAEEFERGPVPGRDREVAGPAGARIAVVVERRYLGQDQPHGLAVALEERGHDVTAVDPEAEAYRIGSDRWLEGLDVVVGRGRSLALLCLLGWAERRGKPTINRRSAIAAVHNKVEMAVALTAASVPTPVTFLGTPETLAARVPEANYPLILKPSFGDNCRGLQVVESAAELARLVWPEPVVLAQRYLPSNGHDLKLYGIGDRVWAVRKPSPLWTHAPASPSEPEIVPVTPELWELCRGCGRLFGLDLYGVDCVETPDGPVVIEVNDFPNYTAVPDADGRLADYVLSRLELRP
jgi:ribosomal protein S6--L-glutamate ligase